jgi:hypothetical protein
MLFSGNYVGSTEFFSNVRYVLQNASLAHEPSAWPSPWTGHYRRGVDPGFR